MRDICFRGQQNDTREWRYGSFAQVDGDAFIISPFSKMNDEYGVTVPDCVQVLRETVGEFTGLVDQNGKQVFEGDYCRLTRTAVLAYGIITFRNGCFWFVETAMYEEGKQNWVRLCDLDVNGFKIEVKGNIHDSPKLAEV
ncbi:MAG: hypothetical protein IJT94_11010 [Oscillibacter sp.]|nr:hypothetical protein [Oscillibacter sp.]